MSHSPARTEYRYNVTSKTTKADMHRIIMTQGQELLNTADRAHQLDMELQAAKATIDALRDNNADLKTVIARQDEFIDQAVKNADDQAKRITALEAKIEQDAATMRKLIASRNSQSPAKEDIARCCQALGKKSVSRDELMDWLRRNPRPCSA